MRVVTGSFNPATSQVDPGVLYFPAQVRMVGGDGLQDSHSIAQLSGIIRLVRFHVPRHSFDLAVNLSYIERHRPVEA